MSYFNFFARRIILIFIDIFIVSFSYLLTFFLKYGNNIENFYLIYTWHLKTTIILAVIIYLFTGQYKSLTNYIGSTFVYGICLRNFIIILFSLTIGKIFDFKVPEISSLLLFWITLTSLITFTKFILRDILIKLINPKNIKRKRVAIYGTGSSGIQLAYALKYENTHSVIFFIDDNPLRCKRNINGTPIYSPSLLSRKGSQIDQIFLAINSISFTKRRQIIDNLKKYKIPVLEIPSVNEIALGKYKIQNVQPIAIEDLLGRDRVTPDSNLMVREILNSSICITGAGGSIGSELCRQILLLNPKKLILIENCEFNLYKICEELTIMNVKNITILPILGSANNRDLLMKIFKENLIDIVFHAAAYKHVPLVEKNPLQGIHNNVNSTRNLCEISKFYKVKKFILISTDKAVRPTNIMGASKRLAELVVQAFQIEISKKELGNQSRTQFSMVRFGNVLGSSGSVVPLFKKQIKEGGPITLTHKDVVRYFMTITEAAQLVIQAMALSKGGDLFLLDMGNPVRIYDLAKQMIELSGLNVRDKRNPDGDIEIDFVGLRDGEKLYEELLIDSKSEETKHPLIFKAYEKHIKPQDLWPLLHKLNNYISKMKTDEALDILAILVPEWVTSKKFIKKN